MYLVYLTKPQLLRLHTVALNARMKNKLEKMYRRGRGLCSGIVPEVMLKTGETQEIFRSV
jgi:hypothetical protein